PKLLVSGLLVFVLAEILLVLLIGLCGPELCLVRLAAVGIGELLRRPEDVGRSEQLRGGRGGGAPVPGGRWTLRCGEQRRERPRQSVDLVQREDGAVRELWLVLGEQPLEPQKQREFAPPGRRGVAGLGVGVELRERRVECSPPGRARRERDARVLATVQEALSHELFTS